jgi:hypothetical protein
MGKTILEQSKTTTKGEILFTIKKIKHYGFFVSKKEAQDHFSNLPTHYKWKTETYAREFIDILSLEEFKQHRHKKWFKRKVNNNDRRK